MQHGCLVGERGGGVRFDPDGRGQCLQRVLTLTLLLELRQQRRQQRGALLLGRRDRRHVRREMRVKLGIAQEERSCLVAERVHRILERRGRSRDGEQRRSDGDGHGAGGVGD